MSICTKLLSVLMLLLLSGLPVFSQPVEKIRLLLKWKHQFQFAGYYAAIEKGYFQDVNLNVELIEPQSEISMIDEVIRGKAEFGIAGSDLILNRLLGKPVVLLGCIYQHSPLVILTLNPEIKNIHDLSGKSIEMEPHSTELIAFLQSEGLSAGSYQVLNRSYNIDEILNGKSDAISAYITDEPFHLKQTGRPYQIFNPRSSGIDFYGDLLFTTENERKQHPERIRDFLEASKKGWKYAIEHTEEMIELILNQYSNRNSKDKLTFEAKNTIDLIETDVVEPGYINPGRIERIAEIFKEQKLAPAYSSLKGFYFQTDNKKDLTVFYIILSASILVLALILMIALRFYQLNILMKKEIRERALAEEKLKEEVVQKEYLMKELQHRVKNNLTIISSLIDLEKANLQDPVSIRIFDDTKNRIRSMVSLYKQLYSESVPSGMIDLKEYIVPLAENLIRTYVKNPEKIELRTSIEPLVIDMKRAVPFGLIINELLTNSIKYGISFSQKLVIQIRLDKLDDFIRLIIEDNGPGLPENYNQNSGSLGMKLVQILTEQIGGELKLEPADPGLKAEIFFIHHPGDQAADS